MANGQLVIARNRPTKYVIPLMDVTAYSAFTNQPGADDVEVISNSASDTGLITMWYLEQTTGILKSATKNLNGTTAVSMIGANTAGTVLGLFLGDTTGNPLYVTPAVGTITVREKSAAQTITTIAATKISKGRQIFNGLKGRDVLIINMTGNTWESTEKYWASTAGIGRTQLTGSMGIDEVVTDPDGVLSLMSDTTGSTVQVKVWGD